MEIQYIAAADYFEKHTMNPTVFLVLFGLLIPPVSFGLQIEAVPNCSSRTTMQPVRFARCFQDAELSESIDTLKLQAGGEVAKVYGSLLNKARTVRGCRTQLVQALINSMAQATDPTANHYQNYFLWENGASLLAELKATEALDLLIANIDLTDGWSTSISQSHFPALVAILKIGVLAIPKLQFVLSNNSGPHRRKFAAFLHGLHWWWSS